MSSVASDRVTSGDISAHPHRRRGTSFIMMTMLTFITLVCTICCFTEATSGTRSSNNGGGEVVIKNSHVMAIFGPSNMGFPLIHYSQSSSPTQSSIIVAPITDIFSTEFVIEGAQSPVVFAASHTSLCTSVNSVLRTSGDGVLLQWNQCHVDFDNMVNISVNASLTDTGTMEWVLSVRRASTTASSFGLWSYTLNVGTLSTSTQDVLLRNQGFGVLTQCIPDSLACARVDADYPQATLQFLAGYNTHTLTDGWYVAAHDPHAYTKHFSVSPATSSTATVSVSAQPPNSGYSFTSFTSFTVALSAFNGDWWDASDMYRQWALAAPVDWIRNGPIKERTDTPAWLLNATVWVNSHWQGNDIFNISGGDPSVLEARMAAIVERFALDKSSSLGLHYYEWDTLGYKYGSNYTVCETEVTCGFDTHYPEYFPPREGFAASLARMQALGVKVVPYINGRIFDMGTQTWHDHNDQGHANAAKDATVAEYQPPQSSLQLYEESYGSRALFAVTCPHTQFWQMTISNVTGVLAQSLHVDGVYIDQIAAAGPRACFDSTHNHTLGGGNYWTTGYRQLLDDVRENAADKSFAVLTESNAEPFMDGINLYLSLVGFGGNFSSAAWSYIVPAFPAIYGGYYLAMGAVFYEQDLTGGDPNVFAAKLATQFVFGAQLGWMSLGGRDNQVPYMGMFDVLMDSTYDPEIVFLQALSRAKLLANPYQQFGRRMRDVPLVVNGSSSRTSRSRSTAGHHPVYSSSSSSSSTSSSSVAPSATILRQLRYDAVVSGAWLYESSLLVSVITVVRDTPASVAIDLDMRRYGFPNAASEMFTVTTLGDGDGGGGVYNGTSVCASFDMNAREVVLLKISRQSDDTQPVRGPSRHIIYPMAVVGVVAVICLVSVSIWLRRRCCGAGARSRRGFAPLNDENSVQLGV